VELRRAYVVVGWAHLGGIEERRGKVKQEGLKN
jgi:hypothetical protein